jgi:hypothetical protein
LPKCSVCGNDIANLPAWLNGVEVKFRCGSPKCSESVNAALTFSDHDEEEPKAAVIEEEDAVLEEEIEAELDEVEEEG